jgi:hypothetical protein
MVIELFVLLGLAYGVGYYVWRKYERGEKPQSDHP